MPCRIDDLGRPVPVTRTTGGEEVLDYVRDITRRAGLTTRFVWNGDAAVDVLEEEL